VKYAFIRQHSNDFAVKDLCRMLRVQRSAYYDWRAHPGKVVPPQELALRRRMRALFAASRDSLGSRTMMRNLRDEGFEIGRDKTRRLMKRLGLKVKQKRKYKVTTDSKHNLPVANNVLNREFSPSAPNQAWGTDITYLWTQQGWIYLAVVIDLYSRRVVGWAIDRRMKTALVVRALMMATNLRKPPPGLICHSDRGSQYASHDYQKLLKQHKMICSMSRKGDCWDNAPVERFFSSLKREWTGDRLYRTRQEAKAEVREYVAVEYNSRPVPSTLDETKTMNYEKRLTTVSDVS
jgi:transposase InsO family protein